MTTHELLGVGNFTPVGYYRIGSSAPRSRARGYIYRRKAVFLIPAAEDDPDPTPANAYPVMQHNYTWVEEG